MRLTRFYTQSGSDSVARTPLRSVTGEDWVEYVVPQHWNQAAADTLREGVFYPDVLPALTKRVEEAGVPEWLWRSEADHEGLDSISAEWRFSTERDIREVLHRMAGALTYRGWKQGLFESEEDAQVFYDEFRHILLHQIAAPELSLWKNLGLDWAYGLPAPCVSPAHKVVAFDAETDKAFKRIRLLGETAALETPDRKCRVTLPVENADSRAFISWKREADIRRTAEDLGRRALAAAANHVMDACDRDGADGFDPSRNPALAQAAEDARRAGLTETAIRMAIGYAQQGYEEISFAPPSVEEEAEGSNVAAVLSLSDEFIEAALTGHGFKMDTGGHCPADKLWDTLAEAVWSSGEPAVSFRSSIDSASPVAGAAGDGGFVFLPGSEAPAAVIHLQPAAGENIVDIPALRHTARIMTTALEIVSPEESAYRPLLLGVTNMSALLMGKGIAYDSDAGRATAALVAGFVSGAAQEMSAQLAAARGAFPAWEEVSKTCLQTVKDKMAMLAGVAFLQKGMTRRPAQIRVAQCPDAALAEAVKSVWEEAYRLGKETGFRHAHLTGIDTEPAVQALLGAATQDIMPVMTPLYGREFNPVVQCALEHLGYTAAERDDIYFHAAGHGTLLDAPTVNHKSLRAKGFPKAALDAVEAALSSALHIRYVFNKWTLGEDFCRHVLGFSEDDLESGAFDMLSALGFTEEEIAAANAYCCGAMTLAGAARLKAAHLDVFDCIVPGGEEGRAVSPLAQVKMQAAVEPFLSGAVAHTVMLDYPATIEDVQRMILTGWELGVKNLRLYRHNCSLMHPLAAAPEVEIKQNQYDGDVSAKAHA